MKSIGYQTPENCSKIAADHYCHQLISCNGFSTLLQARNFGTQIAGRKTELWLTPMINADLDDFNHKLEHRLLHGGLPPFFRRNFLNMNFKNG